MKTTRSKARVSLGMALMVAASFSHATESGGSAYAHGAEGWMTGMLPPPGDYYLNYLNYYSADRLNGPDGKTQIDDFSIEAKANVFRYVKVTDKRLWGASYAFQVLMPVVDLEVEMLGQRDSRTGLGDIIVDPFILGWHFDDLHVVAGVDFILPTGRYDSQRLANIGRNYYTIEPALAVTYLHPSGLELSGKLMYDISFENNKTSYESGDEVHMDYAAGWRFGKWSAGVSGYYNKQVTEDRLSGRTVGPDGNRGEVLAIGPSIQYRSKTAIFSASFQKEVDAENRPQGEKVWLNFILPLGG